MCIGSRGLFEACESKDKTNMSYNDSVAFIDQHWRCRGQCWNEGRVSGPEVTQSGDNWAPNVETCLCQTYVLLSIQGIWWMVLWKTSCIADGDGREREFIHWYNIINLKHRRKKKKIDTENLQCYLRLDIA